MTYKTLIIEDEELSQQGLLKLLEKFSEIEVIGTADNGVEAVEKINELKPDLIFLDIQMPGKTGFEVLQDINYMPIVIFSTAYDEYALKAFETNSIDYLLKPIEDDRLAKAIDKLNKMTSGSDEGDPFEKKINNLLIQLENQQGTLSRIHIKIGDEVLFVNLNDAFYFKADNKYTSIFTHDDEYILNDSLSSLEEKLPDNFIRIHRGYIINVDHLKKLKKWFGGKYIAVLNDKNKTEVPVSRSCKDKLLKD
ncbi:MAG: LytTR family DNA-binding domain-containing protein [Candidatus Delongbacteria bacterium]|jgi:two-component system LytT family response regulator|nr:LytTR family DNA-binding domain-containing protein [Candidatus Delongbacteria bacterium]